MPLPARKLHRLFSPLLLLLLAASAVTGIAYRAGKKWFGMDGQTGQAVMEFHTGEWLGPAVAPFYVLLSGAGLLFILLTGLLLARRSRAKGASRCFHRLLGIVLALPLALTALTGVAYEWGQSWFGISEETADFLMTLHEGGWLGRQFKVYYVLVTGSGLLAMGFLGLGLLRGPKK